MADATNKILWKFLADTKNFDRNTAKATKSLSKTQKATLGANKALKAFGGVIAGAAVVKFAGDAVQLAAAAEEVDSKFQAVFGSAEDLTDGLRAWGDVAGVTETRGKDLAATFGNLALAQGLSAEETEALTLQVATLAGDMGSFNDIDPEQVFFDLNKAILTTEREGMKKYGIALTEVEIKQRALEIATKAGRTEFSKGDKALASYQLTVEQAGKAVGDLERTSESTANEQRQLKATLVEIQEEIGRQLLPAYGNLIKTMKNLTTGSADLSGEQGRLSVFLEDVTGNLENASDAGESWNNRLESMQDVLLNAAEEGGFFGKVLGAAGVELSTLNDFIKTTNVELGKFKPQSADAEVALIAMAGAAHQLAVDEDDAAANADDLALALSAIEKVTDRLISKLARGGNLLNTLTESRARGTAAILLGGGGLGGGRDAQGGTIQPGATHLVGEKGPELISPRAGAHITPAHRSGGGGGGGPSITVNFNGVVGDPTAVAEQIQDLLFQYQRTNGTF